MIVIHINTKDTHLQVNGARLVINTPERKESLLWRYIATIFIYPHIVLDSDIILKASMTNTQIIFCDESGVPVDSVRPYHVKTRASLVRRQLLLSIDPASHRLPEQWLKRKFERRAAWLMESRSTHRPSDRKVTLFLDEVEHCSNYRAREAVLDKMYYRLLSNVLPAPMKFKTRTRRPAKDYTNALLNYTYGLLYPVVDRCILKTGLDPHLGFHHGMARGGKALLFDIIEMYRPWCEILLWNNRETLSTLTNKTGATLLTTECRRYIADAFFKMIYNEKIKRTLRIKAIQKDISNVSKFIKKWNPNEPDRLHYKL